MPQQQQQWQRWRWQQQQQQQQQWCLQHVASNNKCCLSCRPIWINEIVVSSALLLLLLVACCWQNSSCCLLALLNASLFGLFVHQATVSSKVKKRCLHSHKSFLIFANFWLIVAMLPSLSSWSTPIKTFPDISHLCCLCVCARRLYMTVYYT